MASEDRRIQKSSSGRAGISTDNDKSDEHRVQLNAGDEGSGEDAQETAENEQIISNGTQSFACALNKKRISTRVECIDSEIAV